jgi:tetratricopeptide (TPR) repeat protein
LLSAARQTFTDAERRAVIADLESGLSGGSALTSVDVLYGRGQLRRAEGRLDDAAELLKEVLAYDHAHVGARAALAYLALAQGNDDLAQYYSASAVDLQQGFGPVYLARERRFLPTGILGLEGALVDFAKEVADGPDNAMALANRGLVHLRRAPRLAAEGAAEDARHAVKSAIEDHDATLVLHPKIAGALNNRAVCHMQAERLAALAGDSAAAAESRALAEADLGSALAGEPALAEAHFNLGVFSLRSVDLLRKLGNGGGAARYAARARRELQRALVLAPANWPHRRACVERLADVSALPFTSRPIR